jgi:hypothetical protein
MGASIKESTTVTAVTKINSIDPDDISAMVRPQGMNLGLFSVRLTTANPGDTATIRMTAKEPDPIPLNPAFPRIIPH